MWNAVAMEYDFEKLYEKYAPAVYGQIFRTVKNKQLAEEILENVFVTGYNNLKLKPRFVTPLCYFLNLARKQSALFQHIIFSI